MGKIIFIFVGVAVSLLPSCAKNDYVDMQTSELKHSSPEVISLYAIENNKQRRQAQSNGFFAVLLDGLISGMLGSSPDDDDDFYRSHDRHGSSDREKKEFVSKNEDRLKGALESKKQ